MKKECRGFIAGIVVAVMLLGSTAMAQGIKQNIEVVLNSVNLKVNGNTVNTDNILYNGKTYVPLRDVAESLEKEVGWDNATKTASINDKHINSTVKKEETKEKNEKTKEDKATSESDIKAKLEKDYTSLNGINFTIDDFTVESNPIKNSIVFKHKKELNIMYTIDSDDYLKWLDTNDTDKEEWLKKIYNYLTSVYKYPDTAIYFNVMYQDDYSSYPGSHDPKDITVTDDLKFRVTETIAEFNNMNGNLKIELD